MCRSLQIGLIAGGQDSYWECNNSIPIIYMNIGAFSDFIFKTMEMDINIEIGKECKLKMNDWRFITIFLAYLL